jgi:hypothetical protein
MEEGPDKIGGYQSERDAATRKRIEDVWGRPELKDRSRVMKPFDKQFSEVLMPTAIQLCHWLLFFLNLNASRTGETTFDPSAAVVHRRRD